MIPKNPILPKIRIDISGYSFRAARRGRCCFQGNSGGFSERVRASDARWLCPRLHRNGFRALCKEENFPTQKLFYRVLPDNDSQDDGFALIITSTPVRERALAGVELEHA